jgi:hypothetical protein
MTINRGDNTRKGIAHDGTAEQNKRLVKSSCSIITSFLMLMLLDMATNFGMGPVHFLAADYCDVLWLVIYC